MDGDGLISLFEMEHFYRDIEKKLSSRNMETLSFSDVVCNVSQTQELCPLNGLRLASRPCGAEERSVRLAERPQAVRPRPPVLQHLRELHQIRRAGVVRWRASLAEGTVELKPFSITLLF